MSSFVENINTVAGVSGSLTRVADNLVDIKITVDNIETVKDVSENIVAIQNAASDAASAAGSAAIALQQAIIATDKAEISTEQANIAIAKANETVANAIIVNAYGNLDWAGFIVSEGDLIITYFDSSTSVPSLVEGDFILTY